MRTGADFGAWAEEGLVVVGSGDRWRRPIPMGRWIDPGGGVIKVYHKESP